MSNMDTAGEDWHMVELGHGSDAEGDERSLDSVVDSSAADNMLSERAVTPFTESLSDHEDHHDGLASPESERLADSVLCQPVEGSPPSSLSAADTDATQQAAAPQTLQPASGEPSEDSRSEGSSSSNWCFDRASVRRASRLSGEGALEGFADPTDLMLAATPTAHAQVAALADELMNQSEELDASSTYEDEGSVYLGFEGLLHDVATEITDWGKVAASAAQSVWSRVQGGTVAASAAVKEVVKACHKAVHQTIKVAHAQGSPVWVIVTTSSVALVAVACLAHQFYTNRRLQGLVRQRDRELARLVVKIMNLQDSLHNSTRSMPVLRHISLDRFAAASITSAL